MPLRLRRSCLAVPGSSERMLAKARELGADEVVLDLEDGVAPADKELAREQVVQAIADGGFLSTVAIRINGVGTRWHDDDVAALSEARPDCVVVPKVDGPELLEALRIPDGVGIEAQVETARGLVEVERIAAHPRLEGLVFGPGDFGASLGVPVLTVGASDPAYPGDQWHYPLARIVVAARAFGLQAVDGPFAGLDDLDGFRASARRSQLLGYDGKWVIHPDQIAPCNELFTPPPDQVARAERILEDVSGAARLDGEMVDEATRKLAEGIVLRARAGR
jgi:citrate lyase subunit beta / citryl-CoA lyase